MPYKILPTKEFSKDFKKLDKFLQKRIKNKIEEVSENPERYKHLFSYDIELRELYLEKIVFGHEY